MESKDACRLKVPSLGNGRTAMDWTRENGHSEMASILQTYLTSWKPPDVQRNNQINFVLIKYDDAQNGILERLAASGDTDGADGLVPLDNVRFLPHGEVRTGTRVRYVDPPDGQPDRLNVEKHFGRTGVVVEVADNGRFTWKADKDGELVWPKYNTNVLPAIPNCIDVSGVETVSKTTASLINGRYYLQHYKQDGRHVWAQPMHGPCFEGRTMVFYLRWYAASKTWWIDNSLRNWDSGMAHAEEDCDVPSDVTPGAWGVADMGAEPVTFTPRCSSVKLVAENRFEKVHQRIGELGLLMGPHLLELDIGDNGFNDAMVRQLVKPLATCAGLTLFNLSNAECVDVGSGDESTTGELVLRALAHCPKLESIRVQRLPLTEHGCAGCTNDLPGIQGLDFTPNDGRVFGGRLAQISKACPNLRVLDISLTGAHCGNAHFWLSAGGLIELDVRGCSAIESLANFGDLYHCNKLKELNIEGFGKYAIGSRGLDKLLGRLNEENEQSCRGFPPGLQRLKCGGNNWTSNDILKIMNVEGHQKLEIKTDGQPGEIIEEVRRASPLFDLASKCLSPRDGFLLAKMIDRHGCDSVVQVDISFNALKNEGVVESGLLKALAGLPVLRGLKMAATSLEESDSICPITALSDFISDGKSFPKLTHLQVQKNGFSATAQKTLWEAWLLSGRSDKFSNIYDALEFFQAGETEGRQGELWTPIVKATPKVESHNKIDLRKLNITTDECATIVEPLTGHAASEVLLAGNSLGDKGLKHLLPALLTMPHLTHINLQATGITYEGANLLQKALGEGLKSLTRLDISPGFCVGSRVEVMEQFTSSDRAAFLLKKKQSGTIIKVHDAGHFFVDFGGEEYWVGQRDVSKLKGVGQNKIRDLRDLRAAWISAGKTERRKEDWSAGVFCCQPTSWACPRCTFINKGSVSRCDMCTEPGPEEIKTDEPPDISEDVQADLQVHWHPAVAKVMEEVCQDRWRGGMTGREFKKLDGRALVGQVRSGTLTIMASRTYGKGGWIDTNITGEQNVHIKMDLIRQYNLRDGQQITVRVSGLYPAKKKTPNGQPYTTEVLECEPLHNDRVDSPGECQHGHTLKEFENPWDTFLCGVCEQKIPRGSTMYSCQVCDFSKCEVCELEFRQQVSSQDELELSINRKRKDKEERERTNLQKKPQKQHHTMGEQKVGEKRQFKQGDQVRIADEFHVAGIRRGAGRVNQQMKVGWTGCIEYMDSSGDARIKFDCRDEGFSLELRVPKSKLVNLRLLKALKQGDKVEVVNSFSITGMTQDGQTKTMAIEKGMTATIMRLDEDGDARCDFKWFEITVVKRQFKNLRVTGSGGGGGGGVDPGLAALLRQHGIDTDDPIARMAMGHLGLPTGAGLGELLRASSDSSGGSDIEEAIRRSLGQAVDPPAEQGPAPAIKTTYRYAPLNDIPMSIRNSPDMDDRSPSMLDVGDTFEVSAQKIVNKTTWLRLADGRGWVYLANKYGPMCVKVEDVVLNQVVPSHEDDLTRAIRLTMPGATDQEIKDAVRAALESASEDDES